MAISSEGKIGIGLTLLFGLGGGAVVVAPQQLWIAWTIIAISLTGLVILGIYHFWPKRNRLKLGIALTTLGTVLILAGVIIGLIGAFIIDHPKVASEPASKLKETGRFLFQPGQKGKKFTVDSTNPNDLTYKEVTTDSPIAKSNNEEPPNVLSVFVHDSTTLDMTGAVISAAIDLVIPNYPFRIFYYGIYNFQAESKYLSVFVAHSPYTFSILEGMAISYQRMFDAIDPRLGLDYQAVGQSGVSKTWELKFSGRINIYIDDQLDTQQLGTLIKLFKDNGVSAYFYSTDYVFGAWSNIRLGKAAPIDLYELRGAPPVISPVSPK